MTGPLALVTVVIPAKDEEHGIADTLRRIPRSTLEALGYAVEVVVLDGHSTDRTAEIAAGLGATVIPDTELGKGAALRNARHRFQGQFVVMLDADGTYPPDAIPRVVAALHHGADVVMGRRLALPGSMSLTHKAGNFMLSTVATALYGRRCPDLCTGLWGFRAHVLRALPLQSRRFGVEAELFALSSRRGHRFAFIAADYLPRQGYPKLRLVRDGLRILRRLVVSRFRPLRGRSAAVPRPSAAAVDGKGAA